MGDAWAAILVTYLSSFIDLTLLASRISGVFTALSLLGTRLHGRTASLPPKLRGICCLYCYCLAIVKQFDRVGSEALSPRKGHFKKETGRELQDAAGAI